MSLLRLLALLLVLALTVGCPPRSRGDDDDAANDDDSASDDDDATGDDDDDATGDDDDATGDDDDATGDDDDATGGPCGVPLTFTTGDTESCSEPWTEAGVEMSFRNGACSPGSCSAAADSSGVWVYPAEIYVDFSELNCTPAAVEVDIIDWAGSGAADVVLYDAGGNILASGTNSGTGNVERITLNVTSGTPVAFGVSGCETQVVGGYID